jgi:hypothetical protein
MLNVWWYFSVAVLGGQPDEFQRGQRRASKISLLGQEGFGVVL